MTIGLEIDELKAFEVYVPTNTSLVEEIFGIVLLIILALFMGFGWFCYSHKVQINGIEQQAHEVNAHYLLEENKPPVKPVKPELKPPALISTKLVNLTNKPVLAQKEDDTEHQPAKIAPVVRRVYGLRKVYSVGISEQGTVGDAIIGKIGNTLNAPIDTIQATPQDLKGSLVPVTTVTNAPVPKQTPKPEYSKEMIYAKIEGVIKAQLLIDIDGAVKEVKILNDLGFGTAQAALQAFRKWQFEPAKRSGTPVAVWITYSIRFVLL